MIMRFIFKTFLLILAVGLSACSSDDSESGVNDPEVVWEYESFVCEAYARDGSNPYLNDQGKDMSKYPLGKVITRDEMNGEQDLKISFGEDGYIYKKSNWGDGEVWHKYAPYKVEGNFMTGEGCNIFFPAAQVAPRYFGATDVTNEILEWSDTRLCVKQTQVDENLGITLIFTNNFRRVVVTE